MADLYGQPPPPPRAAEIIPLAGPRPAFVPCPICVKNTVRKKYTISSLLLLRSEPKGHAVYVQETLSKDISFRDSHLHVCLIT